MRISTRWLSVAVFLLPVSAIFAAKQPIASKQDSADTVTFARDVQPIFAQKCLDCHGLDKDEGGLRLHSQQTALVELDSGERAIVPGDAKTSELLRRVTSDDLDERMPPKGEPLSEQEVALLRRWIEQGAAWEVHWAYRPLDKPKRPSVQNASWPRNDIDYFVLGKLEHAGIEPSPPANRYTLIKRLYYDLIGLPPTPDEVDAFVADASPKAYENLVDRLLASQHFGERWGRHWLDKARYADSDGYEKDNNRPDAWRYRDWVIDAINADLPFDQFTLQQLAGDMLPEAGPMARLATAFNRQTLTNTEGGTDQEQWRVAAVMDRTETLGAVWLGLTVGCARCHNHKYDQFTQREYYQLFAFLNNGDETNTDVPVSTVAAEEKGQEVPTMKVRVIARRTKNLRKTHILRRGEFKQPLDEVQSQGPTTLPPVTPRDEQKASDRLDLAHWLVNGHNPLVPRVTVNHIWKHLFGEGIVQTMNDFGVRGDPPTHPQLLEYLAEYFVRRGWSRKAMIKQIVMSSTYRQSSRHRPELTDIDAVNRLLYRQNRFRVEAEIMRDVTLAVSGLLSAKVGGPSVFPPIPKSVTDLTYNSSFEWKTSKGDDRYRRGMYTFFKRTAPHPNLITFDCPDSNVTNVERDSSNTPIGALVTLNNEVYVEAAQAMTRRVLTKIAADDAERLKYAIKSCVARPPTDYELKRFTQLLNVNRKWYKSDEEAAGKMVGSYGAAGIPPAENAAWIATVRMILNLDEFITRG